MASLAAGMIVYKRYVPPNMIDAMTFGQPRVGNEQFAVNHGHQVTHTVCGCTVM